MSKVRTCLWFDGPAEGKPLMVNFHLAGVPYQGLNGGDMFKLSPATSIQVITEGQPETDRFGVSWQVVPR